MIHDVNAPTIKRCKIEALRAINEYYLATFGTVTIWDLDGGYKITRHHRKGRKFDVYERVRKVEVNAN